MDGKKMNNTYSCVEKPDSWPVNMAEQSVEIISKALDDFVKNPGYVTKENLISLISEYDLNERAFLGEYRVSEYEVAKINEIYYRGLIILLPSVRCYLYSFIGERARMQKMMFYTLSAIDKEKGYVGIKVYEDGLCLPLKLYYFAYLAYTVDKDKPFADKILEVVDSIQHTIESTDNISAEEKEKCLFELSRNYTMMLNDLSYFHGNKKDNIWKFDRSELTKLFALESKLIKLTSQNPTERPLFGVLMTQISNFILKSRHNYNEDYICKYISEDVAESSYDNHEIWMNKIENLNDDREGSVLKELFEEKEWIKSDWVHKPDFTPVRKYFVSSFAKSLNNDDMKDEYGEVVFGYKNDRIADLISPLYEYGKEKKKNIFFSQVMAYDVLYDREEAKEELNYLFSVIELFDMNDIEKNAFLQELLQYWLLSIKDPDWSKERERRYVLFLYDSYEYKEMIIEDNFLKLKTSLFLLPDFVIGNHRKKNGVKMQVDAKRKYLSYRKYLFCHDCLNRDYDVVARVDNVDKCSICLSSNIEIVYSGEMGK